jgi:phosphinothricin acetyltransferase
LRAVKTDSKDTPIVRPADAADAARCLEIYAPFVRETPVSFEIEVPTSEDFARRIAETTMAYPWLVAEIGGVIVAYAYACPHRVRPAYKWSAEVSAYVADGCRRRGVGRALYLELLDVLNRQGYANAYAGIALPNPESVAFHESMGFEPVGVYKMVGFKLGRWHDVGWWSRRLTDGSASPIDPIPYREIRRL